MVKSSKVIEKPLVRAQCEAAFRGKELRQQVKRRRQDFDAVLLGEQGRRGKSGVAVSAGRLDCREESQCTRPAQYA